MKPAPTALAPLPSVTAIGQAADRVAARHAFSDYRSRKAKNTLDRQGADLACFAHYLNDVGVQVGDLANDPQAWLGITFGLVTGFVRWQLKNGAAIGTVNIRLSTVKVYAQLAAQAGTLTPETYSLIRSVKGYKRTEAKRVDDERASGGTRTRQSNEKALPTPLAPEQARQLRIHPRTPQGRRDAVLMGLLLDLGLRVSEVCGLTVSTVDLKNGTLTFYRSKVDKVQTHRLARSLLSALKAYFAFGDAPAAGPLLRQSIKNGRLSKVGLTRSGIFKRVGELGLRLGLIHLSPHDCRHYWATQAARHKTPIDRLKDAGGWSSPAMPLRYIEDERIANEGVILEPETESE